MIPCEGLGRETLSASRASCQASSSCIALVVSLNRFPVAFNHFGGSFQVLTTNRNNRFLVAK